MSLELAILKKTVFQLRGGGLGGWADLRCQVWGETSSLSVSVKDKMPCSSGAQTLAMITVNYWGDLSLLRILPSSVASHTLEKGLVCWEDGMHKCDSVCFQDSQI